jgi:ferric-dicitrate binding protein FerR (iron transport regulator)
MTDPPPPDLRDKLSAALPPPEPPPAASQRIREGILNRLESERRFRTKAGWFAAAMAGAAAVALMARFRSPVASGGASVEHAGNAPSVIALHNDSRVLIRPGATLRVTRDDEEATAIELCDGVVFASVGKRRQGAFTVACTDTSVEVMGTVFGVEAKNGIIRRVGLAEGTVSIRKGATLALLHPGETWPSGSMDLRMSDEELAGLAAAMPSPEPVAAPASPEPAPATPEAAASEARSTVPRPEDEPKPDRAKQRGALPDPRWQRAKQTELRGEWQEAAALYRELAASSSELAEDALFALGRAEQRQGHAKPALVAFRSYRERFPTGAYARAADSHVLELLVAAGDHEEALAEASRFLHSFARDPRAWKFRQTRASLYAARGECQKALADIEALPESDETTAVRARCAGGADK